MRTARMIRAPGDVLARQRIPALVHLAHDRRDARMRAVMPARGQLALAPAVVMFVRAEALGFHRRLETGIRRDADRLAARHHRRFRSEEHTSELQSLMRISYAV